MTLCEISAPPGFLDIASSYSAIFCSPVSCTHNVHCWLNIQHLLLLFPSQQTWFSSFYSPEVLVSEPIPTPRAWLIGLRVIPSNWFRKWIWANDHMHCLSDSYWVRVCVWPKLNWGLMSSFPRCNKWTSPFAAGCPMPQWRKPARNAVNM